MTDIKITPSPYGTWEYIPAGGMALTAEQVEDVRTVLEYAGGMPHESRIRLRRAALRLVDAVGYPNAYLVQELREALAEVDGEFPATEPAEVSGNIFAEGNSSPTVVQVHHHDIEAHASSFNEGYEEAMRQLAESESVDIESLIEKSSLGTESAQALISTVSPEHGRRVAQEAARREAGTKVKLTELQRDLLQRIVDQWTKGAGWTHVFWSGTVEALISASCIVRHEEAFNEYRPTIFGEKALAPAEPAEEETKAERDSQGIIRINGGRIVALSRDPRELVQQWYDLAEPGSKWQRDYAAALDLFDREAASSPVVPDPTETGPWQRIEDVPKDVMVRGTDGTWRGDPDGWLRSPGARASANQCAPFVAAEEG